MNTVPKISGSVYKKGHQYVFDISLSFSDDNYKNHSIYKSKEFISEEEASESMEKVIFNLNQSIEKEFCRTISFKPLIKAGKT